MTNKERAENIYNLIGFKKTKENFFSRPADIIADIMHHCDNYFYYENLDKECKYNFLNELEVAKQYYEEEKIEEETICI